MYAGDPNKLSMKSALKKVYALEDLGFNSGIFSGAYVRIQQIAAEKKQNAERDADLPSVPGGSLGTFKEGLQSLPIKVQNLLGPKRARLNHKLVEVSKTNDGLWQSTFEVNQNNRITKKVIISKALILTSPAYATADIVGGPNGVSPNASRLKEVNYPPVASVTIAYPNEAFKEPLVGFGHLIPRKMKVRTLGTIWSSSLFPGRAPPGYTMLLNYIGGSQDIGIASLTKEEIVEQVHNDVKKILLKPDAPKPRVLGVRVWPRAIPQYEKGHAEIINDLDKDKINNPGLFLGGNYRTGVAFGDCIQYGVDVAKEVENYITK